MKVYIDLVFLINIYFDFIIILTTSLILKRNASLKRIVLGSITGGFTIILLFFKLNNILIFLFKFVFSVLMVLVSFSYKDFKYFINNLFYLYITSFVLGGCLYLLELEFNFNNIILILIFSLIILYFYLKQINGLKYNYNNYCKVIIEYKDKIFNLVGFIDSGNRLCDQYKNRAVSLLYSDNFIYDYEDVLFVPYETVDSSGVVKCIKVDNLIIDNISYKNELIGFIDRKIKIDGIDIILNSKYIGGRK